MPGTDPQLPDHIRAIVRFRPPATPLLDAPLWDVDSNNNTVGVNKGSPAARGEAASGKNRHFTRVHGPTDNNANVFQSSTKSLVDEFVSGKNACVLAYGCSGSGKTHTIFGYEGIDEGLLPQAVRYAYETLNAQRRTLRYRMAISYYEVYNEVPSDLLNPRNRAPLTVREVQGMPFVDNLEVRVCHEAEMVFKLLEAGAANKSVGYSNVHDKSSRAHTVFTLQLAAERRVQDVVSTQLSRFCFVDLAGSETLTDKYGEQQQRETRNINLSLFCLRNVISALANKDPFVPLRDSVLTRVLSSCLSENSVTAVVCTCSPEPQHAAITAATLRFGELSALVEQRAKLNEVIREGAVKMKDTANEESIAIGQATRVVSGQNQESIVDHAAVKQKVVIDTRQGQICGYQMVPSEATRRTRQRVALLLHAYGNDCSGDDWELVMRALCNLGFTCLAPDFPGFGRTPGPRQASRTDRMDGTGGPMEIVYDALDAVTEKNRKVKALIVGWDWGGNMALILAQSSFKSRLSGLVLYHPSYTNKLDELAAISVPVLLCWIPSDQLHLHSTGKKMARLIRRSKLVSLVMKPGSDRHYDQVWQAIATKIVEWLPSQGILGKPSATSGQSTIRSPEDAIADSGGKGKEGTGHGDPTELDGSDADNEGSDSDDDFSTQSSFLACILCDPIAAATVIEGQVRRPRLGAKHAEARAFSLVSDRVGPEKEAERASWSLAQLRLLLSDREKMWVLRDALLQRNRMGSLRSQASGIAGGLPAILPGTPSSFFKKQGLWQATPRGDPFALPKYAPGRQVTVPARVCTDFCSPSFGHADPKGKEILTVRATVAGGDQCAGGFCEVDVPSAHHLSSPSVRFRVPWTLVLRWNQPTEFSPGPHSKLSLVFEDAIVCRYHDTVTKLKMNEIALALAPIVQEMDFAAAIEERQTLRAGNVRRCPANRRLLQQQVSAVKIVRECMNMIHHVQMGKDPTRLCVPDCGRLSTIGQWHCHGMASVLAALLLPFSRAIGVEIRYRDGFFADLGGRDKHVADGGSWDGTPRTTADHTWLELTFFPSQISFVADPSFDAEEGVLVPLEVAYSKAGHRFPVRNLTSGSIESPGREEQLTDPQLHSLKSSLVANDFV